MRGDFTERDDYVFCSRLGPGWTARRCDADTTPHVRRLAYGKVKLHGLRHGAGSLVARETDAVFVQHFLGHAKLSTTERYMHAKARGEDVDRLNRAFGVAATEGTSGPRQ